MWFPVCVFVIFAAALYVWGIWVTRRQRALVYRLAARGVLVGVVLGIGALAWASWRLAQAHEAAQTADPATAAAQLADGISGAFSVAALPIVLSNLILLACAMVFVVGTLRPPSARDRVGSL